MSILVLNNISKSFGTKQVLKGVSCSFEKGIYGLVGANGSGKTTLIRIITGLLKADIGSVEFYGEPTMDNNKFRSKIGYMPQSSKGYEDFTGRQLLWYMASLKQLNKQTANSQIEDLISMTNLKLDIDKKIGLYSGGMRQRLMLIQALLGDPEVVILDEPTAGLDPLERINVRNYISKFSDNRLIIISTHVMQDIESITNNIILLHNSNIEYFGEIEEIIETIKGKVYQKEISHFQIDEYQERYKVSNIIKEKDRVVIRYISEEEQEAKKVLPNLEEVYLHYLVD